MTYRFRQMHSAPRSPTIGLSRALIRVRQVCSVTKQIKHNDEDRSVSNIDGFVSKSRSSLNVISPLSKLNGVIVSEDLSQMSMQFFSYISSQCHIAQSSETPSTTGEELEVCYDRRRK